jgi:hypothetical protein
VGPIDVTLGNIFFYIDRDASTRVSLTEFYSSEDARQFLTDLSNTTLLDNARGFLRAAIPRISWSTREVASQELLKELRTSSSTGSSSR